VGELSLAAWHPPDAVPLHKIFSFRPDVYRPQYLFGYPKSLFFVNGEDRVVVAATQAAALISGRGTL